MEKEIEDLLRQLEKFAGEENWDTSVGVLEELSKTKPSVTVLASTGAGKKVNKFTTHSSPLLAAAAKNCVALWKTLARSSGQVKDSVATGNQGSANVEVQSPSAAQIEIKDDREKPSGVVVSGDTRGGEKVAPPAPKLPPRRKPVADFLRKVLVEMVMDFMGRPNAAERLGQWGMAVQDSEQVTEECTGLSLAIEAEMWRLLGGVNNDAPAPSYSEQFKRLASNLRMNEDITMEIYFGTISPTEVAQLTNEDLLTDEGKKKGEETRRASLEAVMLDWGTKNRKKILEAAGVEANQGFPCKKCKSKNTDYTQKQTRSGDEPMTV